MLKTITAKKKGSAAVSAGHQHGGGTKGPSISRVLCGSHECSFDLWLLAIVVDQARCSGIVHAGTQCLVQHSGLGNVLVPLLLRVGSFTHTRNGRRTQYAFQMASDALCSISSSCCCLMAVRMRWACRELVGNLDGVVTMPTPSRTAVRAISLCAYSCLAAHLPIAKSFPDILNSSPRAIGRSSRRTFH